jgi:hypothetical protein
VRRFACPRCAATLFFNDDHCLTCGAHILYDPGSDWMVEADGTSAFRCANSFTDERCNWLALPDGMCRSCALDLPESVGPSALRRPFQEAKRRTLRQLAQRGIDPATTPLALRFRLLHGTSQAPVTIGHAGGVITLDVAEGDPRRLAEVRTTLGEPYRTPLGHVRHELGHWYWAWRIGGTPAIEQFRALFGDERRPYDQALSAHYATVDDGWWRAHHLSHYASAHPWEDFAESFAHALHLHDTLETAVTYGMVEPPDPADADAPYAAWGRLSVALNELNRAMGTSDPYPFAPSAPAMEKIRWIADLLDGRR